MGDGNNNGNDAKKVGLWVKILSGIIGLVITIGVVALNVDTRYAKATDIVKNSQAIVMNQQDIQVIRLENQLSRVYDRIWQLEKQHGFSCQNCPPEYRQEYNKLKLDIDGIIRRIKKLESY